MRPFLSQIRDYPPPYRWDDKGRHAADDPSEMSQGPAVRPLRTIIAAALTPIGPKPLGVFCGGEMKGN
ncbi:MAG TPA: hypothetical protein VKI18_05920 [Albitalea sp.]|nr:hypothetical protein [Albitalea sp.]